MYRKNRQLETYTVRAHKEGYPARSVYKLKEMDQKYFLFKIGDRVLDLGCAPGSWLLYVSQKIGATGKIIGIDSCDLKIDLPQNSSFIKKDILELKENDFKELGIFNSIISDLAPATTGVKFADTHRSLELSLFAWQIARSVLKKNGNFVCKIFEGSESNDLIKELKPFFKIIKSFRPRAVFRSSREFYVVGLGFLGYNKDNYL
jgi:23S rRNA (uridine2552-2'-O)-methyltransferase